MIPSQKEASNRFDLLSVDPTKVLTRAECRWLAANLQYLSEATRGVSFGPDEGSISGINDLSILTATNYNTYNQEIIKTIQTLIANKNLLIVDPVSTANSITLTTRLIDDETEISGINEAKIASLPFSFRDGLELDFVATANNTGAVTISIPSFQGVSGALNIVKQDLSALTIGDIIIGNRYTIICDETNNRFILKDTFVREATATSKGVSYAKKPIMLTYSTPTVALYSSGTFNFDDQSGSASINSSSINLATTGLNGIDTGSIPTSGWLYTYAIYNPTTGVSGCIASSSPTSPTLPSGFTKKKRIKNGFLRIASSAIQIFSHWENEWITTNTIVVTSQTNVVGFTSNILPVIPLKADMVSYFQLGGAGQSTQVVWGNLKPWTGGTDGLFLATNNGLTASTNGYIYADDGIVRATNPTVAGGVLNSQIILKAISELSN